MMKGMGFVLTIVKWVHRDSNPGSSPCKGDVITGWTMDPTRLQLKMHLNFENFTKKEKCRN